MFVKSKILSLCLVLLGMFVTTSASFAQDKKSFSKDDIEKIVREYILNNPQIIEEAIIRRRQQQVAEQAKARKDAIKSVSGQLFNASHDYVAGNPNGDVTVVEFFDYNCPYCRRAFTEITKVIEKDKNVRVVFKELPIFDEPSHQAARAALASIKQKKYFEFHRDMLLEPGRANMSKAIRIAKKLGMDVKKMEADMKSKEVLEAIAKNDAVAKAIGLQGTPLYVIGDQVIDGAPENLSDQILRIVQATRAQNKK